MQSSALARRVLDPARSKTGSASNGATHTSDFPFPKMNYDAKDDLLSHYASPQRTYDPLPLALFPRPDPETERYDSACFPCFKYYDLSKYSLQDAIRLSAMDIIPKDALKSVKEQTQARAKRLKRTTAESATVAGYYRNKNEGVDMDYGFGKGPGGVPGKADTTRPGRPRRGGGADGEPEKPASASVVFKSILDLGRATSGAPSPKPAGSASTTVAKPTPIQPKPTDDASGVLPRKQGKRTEFLASLRQEARPPTPGMSRLDQQLRPNGLRRLARAPAVAREIPPIPAIPAALPTPPTRRKAPIVTIQRGKPRPLSASPSRPAAPPPNSAPLDTSSSMDDEKLAAEALGVMAHEELGDSDEEMFAYY